jgi:hypothetical protein
LALGVCYQACLKNREEFRKIIFDYFEDPFTLLDENQLETEFTRYLLVFRDIQVQHHPQNDCTFFI